MGAKIKLNIGGQIFITRAETLRSIPDTRLYNLRAECDEFEAETDEYYFDRDPELFRPILNLYRTKELHLPKNICGNLLRLEMEFWGIPEQMISECCWKVMYKVNIDAALTKDMEDISKSRKAPVFETDSPIHKSWYQFRIAVWTFLAKPTSSTIAKVWNTLYFVMILMSVVLLVIQTHPTFRVPRTGDTNVYNFTNKKLTLFFETEFHPILYYIDIICVVIFTVELVLHFVTTPYKTVYLRSILNIIDGIVILSNWSIIILEQNYAEELRDQRTGDLNMAYTVLKHISIFRILRFFKLTERFHSLQVMVLSLNKAFRELFMAGLFINIVATLFGCILFVVEFQTDNDIDNIPIAIWWATVTMTTVGYGDRVPQSDIGRVVGSFCAITGLLVLSMPIAIIATNFNDYHTKDKNRRNKSNLKRFQKKTCNEKCKNGDDLEIKDKSRFQECPDIPRTNLIRVKPTT